MSAARSDPGPARRAELCSESEVADLVQAFYARVRDDPVLGPIVAGTWRTGTRTLAEDDRLRVVDAVTLSDA